MKQINELDYLYASGQVRALEGKLLNRERLLSMVDARTVDDAFEVLTECGYPLPEAFTASALEVLLEKERHHCFDRFAAMLPDQMIVDVFRVRYDYQNIKVLLKKSSRTGHFQFSHCGRIKPDKLQAAVFEKDYRNLPEKLGMAIANAQEILERTGDPQLSDMALDRSCLEEMLTMAELSRSLYLFSYIQRIIDTYNFKTLLRVRRMGKGRSFLTLALFPAGSIPIGPLLDEMDEGKLEAHYTTTWLRETATAGFKAFEAHAPLTGLDRDCDNALLDSLRPAKMMAYGSPLAIAYLAAKESEISTLRMVLSGHLVGMGSEQMMERIRTPYV